jgi:uncharacterized repeat protein (TIGR01451 family)/fimbrial isopeptide formation D2 family protein
VDVHSTTGLSGITGAWTIVMNQVGGSTTFDWNITVRSAGTAQTGRVWTNRYSVLQDDGTPRDLTYWVVNDTGYRYQVKFNDYNGIGSIITANSLGVTTGGCVPTYQSTEGGAGPACGSTYRIFFQAPSADLPASAASADGTIPVLPSLLTTSDLTVDDLAFAPTAPTSASGTFSYTIDQRFTGGYTLQVDTNGNGTYNDAVDRTIQLGADGSGNYSYAFDGLDGRGNAIANDCALLHARILFDKLGEIHVLQNDVEGRAGGIQITRLNGGDAPDTTVYWDDTNLANDRTNATPRLDGTAGVDSTGGVHGWAFDGNSWGNGRTINDWAYDPANFGTGAITIGGHCYTVDKTSTPTNVSGGDTVNYTITVHNTGAQAIGVNDPATFTDSLTGVLDDATYNNDAAATSGTVSYTRPTISWSGTLPVDGTATITYSVKVNDPDTGDKILRNTVTTPPEGGCPPRPNCSVENPVRQFTVKKTASVQNAQPGDTVTYTVVVTNTGQVAYTADVPASFTDDLSAVLDDATYNNDANNGATYAAPTLSWSGALAVGASTTTTYTVTVNTPDAGDGTLTNTANPVGPGGLCADLSQPPCKPTVVQVANYTVTKTSSPAGSVHPGDKITYTVTVHNPSKGDYTAADPASFTDDLSEVLDDATYNNDATSGATYTAPTLSWSGALASGATVTVKYTVTVNDPDTGDRTLTNAADPTAPGGGCPNGEQPPCKPTVVHVQSFSVVKTSSATSARPGDTVTYTVTVTNTGSVDYTAADPASFTDNLSKVIDDATYNNDATNGATYAAPTLSWSGALPVEGTVTVTYSVTVNDPDLGNHSLDNVVVTPPGGGCVPGSPPPGCHTETPVQSYEVVKTADRMNVVPGQRVTYTIKITNTGKVDYTADAPASFTDNLSDVLDDATYNSDADNGATYAAPTLSWSGALAVGATVTITYSATVNDPDTGDQKMNNTVVTPPGSGANCPPRSTDPRCIARVPGHRLEVKKVASTTTATPGQVVKYTITVKNTGQVAYTANDPATFTDDLSTVLDDATYNKDASVGASVKGNTLSWSGAIAVGDTVTVTYSVTVNSPDTGDKLLDNTVSLPPGENSNCTKGSSDPACSTRTPVADYVVKKVASASKVKAGDTVTYTVTVTNTGQVAFTAAAPARFTDDMTQVLDDATYNNDADQGATYKAPKLTWAGALPLAGTATITYSVTVNDPDRGDGKLHNVVTTPNNPTGGNFANCPAGTNSTDCQTETGIEGITISAPAPSAGSTANTGNDTQLELILAMLLLGAGALLSVAGIRRRTR